MTALLEINELSLHFRQGRDIIDALDRVSLSIAHGERVALVGESGSGKTISAIAAMRLLPANATITSGRIVFDGEHITAAPEEQMQRLRGRRVAMIFQNAPHSLNPMYTVGRQIADVYRHHNDCSSSTAWKAAVEALDATGIPDAANRANLYPFEYSGGMAQRAMIAMALACRPSLLIADEPTSGLDVTIQIQVLDLIKRVTQETAAGLLLITHDIGLIRGLCTRVIVMYAGRIMEDGPADRVLRKPANPYTQALLACTEPGEGDFPFIAGRAPDLRHRPPGCPFAPRCPRVQDRCRTENPEPHDDAGRKVTCHFPVPS